MNCRMNAEPVWVDPNMPPSLSRVQLGPQGVDLSLLPLDDCQHVFDGYGFVLGYGGRCRKQYRQRESGDFQDIHDVAGPWSLLRGQTTLMSLRDHNANDNHSHSYYYVVRPQRAVTLAGNSDYCAGRRAVRMYPSDRSSRLKRRDTMANGHTVMRLTSSGAMLPDSHSGICR